MKHLFIFLLLVTWAIRIIAQDSTNTLKLPKNELRTNLGYALLSFPEITYERLLNEESSVGISVAAPLNDDREFVTFKFMVNPFYRLYFGSRKAAFFFEMNGAVFTEAPYFSNQGNDDILGMGLGIGVGGKFATSKNLTVELLAGLGRNLFDDRNITNGYPRMGISLGKRF